MPEKLKVYVYYEDEKDSKKNMKLKIVIPQKWKTEPMSKITSLFVEEYNKKHSKTDKIQLDHCRITKKIGPPLDSKIVQDCVEKYDDLYVRTKVQTVTKEKIDDETLDGYESDWSDSMDHDPVRYAQWYRKQHRKTRRIRSLHSQNTGGGHCNTGSACPGYKSQCLHASDKQNIKEF